MGDRTSVPARLDSRRVHTALAARARASETYARLQAESAARLREHLTPIRLTPGRVLELGAGSGAWTAALVQLYPRATLVAADVVPEPLRVLAGDRRLPWRRRRLPAVMDAAAPAVMAGTIDLLTSNLVLEWIEAPLAAFKAWAAALRPGGLLIFATLGAGTLRELRQAWSAHDPDAVHVHPLADMHDIGDALVGAGFQDVVMDAERISLTYESPRALLADLRRLGVGNVAAGRARGLLTPRRLAAVYEAYGDVPGAIEPSTGRIRATLELVFAHAWAGVPRAIEVAGPTVRRG